MPVHHRQRQYRIESVLGHGAMGACLPRPWATRCSITVAIRPSVPNCSPPATVLRDDDRHALLPRRERALLHAPGTSSRSRLRRDAGRFAVSGHGVRRGAATLGERPPRRGHQFDLPAACRRLPARAARVSTARQLLGIVHRDIKPGQRHPCSPTAWSRSPTSASRAWERRHRPDPDRHDGRQTPNYMSPEQFTGGIARDWRADLYACAVIAYELAADRQAAVYPSGRRRRCCTRS